MSENKDLQAELEALRAENAKLKAEAKHGVSMKVSQKGAVSVYGLGRFPTTLYKGQWEKLIESVPTIQAFIKDHIEELSVKE